jgi:protein-disulfide isomerase
MKSGNECGRLGTTFVRRHVLGLLGVVVLVVAGCGAGDSSGGTAESEFTRGLLAAAASEEAEQDRPSLLREVPLEELGFDRGSDEALVRVIEMSDYGCGYCRRFHLETFPSLRTEFIESGMVEWKFVPYVTGMFDNSREALRAAECVLEQSPEAFERINERLWHEQSEWKASADAGALVRGWAIESGADAGVYDACQSGGRRLDRIAAASDLARDVGVRGTPTFLVVGYGPLQGALPLDTFRQVLHSVYQDVLSKRN